VSGNSACLQRTCLTVALPDRNQRSVHSFLVLLQSWVTATAGLAADQVVALLRDAASRRAHAQQQAAAKTIIDNWEAAICDVHAEYFEEYNRWMQKLCLPVSAPSSVRCQLAASLILTTRRHSTVVINLHASCAPAAASSSYAVLVQSPLLRGLCWPTHHPVLWPKHSPCAAPQQSLVDVIYTLSCSTILS
jgi:hypothetical protein